MIDLLIYLAAFFVTLPFIVTILLYLIAGKVYRNQLRGFHFSVNYTTILYIMAVSIISTLIFGINFVAEIIILMLLMLSIFVFVYWKNQGEIVLRKVWKSFWRSSFLLFSILYFGMVTYGIIERIFF